MTRKLIYRPDALADLNEVERYTRRTWDNDQARRYVAMLVADIKKLRSSALRHPLYDPINPGLRRKRSGMHHIYFIVSKNTVEVLNVIHAQRDPGMLLKAGKWEDEG
ncbi:type II toxin-antitoxin system RelE/ParE family toxin [Novosphingobium sp.]|uniref:type II toxin-antitoxin system RelE/ParE family toxin n=1 Tax=Novosphingobium sp. TaxID=1874826 RepID=UPI0025F21624|nr:type II toxin-antitoxin system RelE/ParE family toxin [Novosphingobium sp.]MCC6926932.1 type II toxin-antitoxin system RelE/ParE family toxin [Novosphingobium sp.]